MRRFLILLVVAVLVGATWFVASTWPWTKNTIAALSGPPSANPDAPSVREPIEKVVGAPRPLARNPSTIDFSAAAAISDKYNGYALLIWHDGAVIFEKYSPPADAETRPESASMHKSVMATLVGAAIADGAIGSVDDPVGKYIPEWKDDPRGRITLRQTLQMASGLAPLSTDGGLFGPMFSANARFQSGLFVRDLTLGRAVVAPPGTQFDYRNQNSQLAGYVIEAATKRRYAEYLSEKIWAPIGANDAYVWLDKTGGTPRTSGSLFAKAEDWVRVGVMLKDRGQIDGKQIVPAAWVDEMTTRSPANPNYGLQVWLASPYIAERYYDAAKQGVKVVAGEDWLDPQMFFFDGFGGQRVYVSRAHNLVIMRSGRPRIDWDDSALPNAVIRALQAAQAPASP